MKFLNKQNVVTAAIILILLAVSLGVWFYINSIYYEHAVAEIYKNGVLIKTIDLSNVKDEYEITVGTPDDGFNTVLIKSGEIGVINSDCPDKICVNTGFISNGIIPVICLPNKLEIRIINGKSDIDIAVR